MKSSCQNLSKIWFLIISFCFHGFTLWNSIIKYLKCKELALSLRHGDNWTLLPLHLYLVCIIISISLFLISIYSTFKNNGHWANDGVMITSDHLKLKNLISKNDKYYPQFYLPFNMFLYLFSAFIIWIPLSWINGEIIRNGAASNTNDDVWSMELGFLFAYGQRFSLKLDAESKELYHLMPSWKAFQEIVQDYYPNNKTLLGTILMSLQPVALGGLGQLPQTQDQILIANKAKDLIVESVSDQREEFLLVNPKISYEIINIFIASIFLTIRLPSVFCLTSKLFTIITSILLSTTLLGMIFETILFSLILKLSSCFPRTLEDYENIYRLDNISLDSLQIIRIFIGITPMTTFTLMILNVILTILLFVSIYEYGVKQFYMKFYQNNIYTSEMIGSQINHSHSFHGGYDTGSGYTKVIRNFKYNNKLNNLYNKKFIQALGLILLALKVTFMIPLLIEGVKLYVKKNVVQILFTIIFTLATSLLWMLIWFCLLIKNNLNFRMKSASMKNYSVVNFNNSTLPRVSNNDIYYRRNSIHIGSATDHFDHIITTAQTSKGDFNLYSCINPNLTVTTPNGHSQMTKSFNYFDASTLNNTHMPGQRSPKPLIVKSKSNYNCNVYDINNSSDNPRKFCQVRLDSNESDDSHGSSNVQSNDSGFINNSLKNQPNNGVNTSFCYNDFIGNAKYMSRKMVGDDISRPTNISHYSDLYHPIGESAIEHSNDDFVPKIPLILDPIPISGILSDDQQDLERVCSQV